MLELNILVRYMIESYVDRTFQLQEFPPFVFVGDSFSLTKCLTYDDTINILYLTIQ